MMFTPQFENLENGLARLHAPKDICRSFYIYDVSNHSRRGGHANKKSRFWMSCIVGSCMVDVLSSRQKETFVLDDKSKMLYMDSMVWKEMHNFSKDAVLLVFSDQIYDANEYIVDWNEYVRECA